MRSIARFLVAAAFASAACNGPYRFEKRVDDLRVALVADEYPLARGDTALRLEIDAPSASPAPQAVTVRTTLPVMPGMGAVNEVTSATATPRGWIFFIKAHTTARWRIEARIARPGRGGARAALEL
jgi:hypothetical protein